MRECLEIRLAEVPSAEVGWGVFVCIYLDSARLWVAPFPGRRILDCLTVQSVT